MTTTTLRVLGVIIVARLAFADNSCQSAFLPRSEQERNYFVASRLGTSHLADGKKYDAVKFPDDHPGTFFSGTFSDHVVLQRDYAGSGLRSAVFGVVIGALPGTKVSVLVNDLASSSTYSMDAVVNVTNVDTKSGLYARWKALLKPSARQGGGNFTIVASCSGCSDGAAANPSTLSDVTFGDVWFCSGQSNMWLPMHFDTSRNRTYDNIMKGKYTNIRMHTVPQNNQPDGGFEGSDLDILPPPPREQPWGASQGSGWLLAEVGTYANKTCREGGGDHGCDDPTHCCTGYEQPDDSWLFNSVDEFSATCWYFAEHLTDMMYRNDETIVPLGLISSAWGGSMVEMWQPNATLNSGVCKNSTGGPYAPWQNQRWDIDSGALYNGMVRPYTSMSIRGALWYQGENNVFQCHDANSKDQSRRGPGGGPYACGDASSTGYACMMKSLVRSWRAAWSIEPNTTPADFAIGIVSLAGGTSEGFPNNMGAFRYAQSANTGLLPNDEMPNTFIAQAYDAGDPCIGGGQCCVNSKDGQGGWPCMSGEAAHTYQFMGGIHPRVKKLIGTRLAVAARALVYGDQTKVWTGPVLSSCSLDASGLTLKFDREKLKHDTIMVLDHTTAAIPFQMDEGGQWTPELLTLLQRMGPESPMEVQLNGGGRHNMIDGVWLPVPLRPKCRPVDTDRPSPGAGACNWNVSTSTKTAGWNEVEVSLGGLAQSLLKNITGVRYAWGENPCCPSINREIIPCPPNSCPIQTFNSTLPAVPFWATIVDGQCDWISTQGSLALTSAHAETSFVI